MPEIPHISWKRLSARELKDFYENDPREYSPEEIKVIVCLIELVEKGKVRAFQKPDGTIYYQYNPQAEKEERS